MKERPILFSGPMVRALLDGSKTQTRRVIAQQPASGWAFEAPPAFGRITSPHPKKDRFGAFIRRGVGTDFPEIDLLPCPYGMPGDRLWVRESFRFTSDFDRDSPARVGERCLDAGYKTAWAPIQYDADGAQRDWGWVGTPPGHAVTAGRTRASMHMPRWASRITLEVTGVRVERLQDISDADAESEGIDFLRHVPDADETLTPSQLYMCLWDGLKPVAGAAWADNPWVWVVEFNRVTG